LELAGAQALSFDDAADNPVLEPPPGQTPLWPTVVLRALFPIDADLRPLCAVLTEACSPRTLETARLDDSQWQNAVRASPPRRIGERLWLSCADDETPAEAARLTHVRLHMGLAFGTGEHPTTALCLEWLERNVREGERVLDYGCGSGVLAITALALGAGYAWAVDDDPHALTAAAANAALNGIGDRLWLGSPADLPPIAADIIVANILAKPLELLAPAFRGCLRARGVAVLSGILAQERLGVKDAYARHFDGICSTEREGWVRIEAHASGAAPEPLESGS
jgi:ribosomal protein L11 methyltransferase